jgi:hypothetical protein
MAEPKASKGGQTSLYEGQGHRINTGVLPWLRTQI